MKKILIITAAVLIVTFGIVATVAYVFTYNDAEELEKKIKPEEVLSEQDLYITPTTREGLDRIEVFTPYDKKNYSTLLPNIRGKTKSDSILVSIDGRSDYILGVDELGVFEASLPIQQGIHMISFLQFNEELFVTQKDITIAYTPNSGDDGDRTIIGEIMGIDSNDSKLRVATSEDLEVVAATGSTEILEYDADDNVFYRIAFKDLQHSYHIGVLADQVNGEYVATQITVDNYPYAFYGVVEEFTEYGFQLRRRSRPNTTSHVKYTPDTVFREWSTTNELLEIPKESLQLGDVVYVHAYVLPQGNRSEYYPYRILKLPIDHFN